MMAPASGSGRCPAWMARVPIALSRSSSKTRVIRCSSGVGGVDGEDNRGGAGAGSRAPGPREQPGAMIEARQGKIRPGPDAPRCLVVDDEPRLRQVLVRLMESDGF